MSWDLQTVLYIGAFGLIVIGLAGMVILKDIFRMVLALAIAEAGANLLLVIAGFRFDAVPPIITELFTNTSQMVDPVPQAMVLTAIVIGVGIQALALAIVVRVYAYYGTLDMRLIHKKMTADIDQHSDVIPLLSPELPDEKQPFPTAQPLHSEAVADTTEQPGLRQS